MRRLQLTALATLLCFGCATVHEPAPTAYRAPAGGAAPRIVLAEPELELWMEGTKAIAPGETAQALEASRSALAEAVSGRGLDGPDADQLLVVRSRAIKLTGERRSAQVWSVVGIVFVVVAVVVLTVVLSRSASRGARGPAGSHAGVPVRPAPVPVPYAPRYYAPPPPIGISLGLAVSVPSPSSPGPWAPPPGAPPMEQRLASRGWFDGDEVELTVEIVDARSGVPSWRRIVRDGIDPRDPAAVTRLLDRALEGLPFGQRLAAGPPQG